jgi:hypothetical protein
VLRYQNRTQEEMEMEAADAAAAAEAAAAAGDDIVENWGDVSARALTGQTDPASCLTDTVIAVPSSTHPA